MSKFVTIAYYERVDRFELWVNGCKHVFLKSEKLPSEAMRQAAIEDHENHTELREAMS